MSDLVRRQHSLPDRVSHAIHSRCGTYRYSLTRTWAPGDPRLLFVLLNPSTADVFRDDPTMIRCERRARALGFGAFRVVNLFAYRATHPADLRRTAAPIGPANDRIMLSAVRRWADRPEDMVLCGWGNHGGHLGRGPEVAARLGRTGRPLHHLGLTAAGAPRHPLYVGYDLAPSPWTGP